MHSEEKIHGKKLITTSVVRGSNQGESHGGVYIIDLGNQDAQQVLDWNTTNIDWQGRGWDRGLRGIAIHEETVYIAASDELFAYTPDFKLLGSWRSPYLKHCHEIDLWQDKLFLSSTGFDSILAFDLKKRQFDWALYVEAEGFRFKGSVFNPQSDEGPLLLNKMHINSICCRQGGMYISGLRTGGMLHFNGKHIRMAVELPQGTHNAQPFRDGVLFNDTEADLLRYTGRGEGEEDRSLRVPKYDVSELTHTRMDDSKLARQGYARGLCVVNHRVVAAGSSPSTVSLYDLKSSKKLMSVCLTMDVRNAVHGLQVWPFD
jgi:hypothetical protein